MTCAKEPESQGQMESGLHRKPNLKLVKHVAKATAYKNTKTTVMCHEKDEM